MNYIEAIAINLFSDLLAWLIVGLLISLLALGGALRRRRRLFSFFGITSSQPKVHVYVSRVNIKPGGATMIGGEEWPSYQGAALSAREFKVLPDLDRMFHSTLLEYLPSSARNRLGNTAAKCEITLSPSPAAESDIAEGTIILLGSRLVNIGTRYYWDNAISILAFDKAEHELVINRGSRKGAHIKPSGTFATFGDEQRYEKDVAIIERINDRDRNRTVILLAGTGTNGTMAAVTYLANHWRDLYDRFGNSSKTRFAIAIECPNRHISENGYLYPVKIDEVIE